MASQYQHRQFFRRVPNTLLARYFDSRDIDLDLDFGKLDETDVEPIFEAFTSLSEKDQASVEIDFQNINGLASEGGIGALLNEAMFYDDEAFPEMISPIDGYHAKSMWAFLHKPEYWKGAASLLHADNVSVSFWKKRNDLPNSPPHVDEEDIHQLEKAISHYFYKTEGRGRNCKIEPYRKVSTGKEYLFAYPEDYGQSGVEWERQNLTTRARHPAFEIIFVYCETEGSLDIYAPKNTKAVPELQKIFASTILKLDTLADGTIDKRVYDLDPLANPGFGFQFPVGSGISNVIVTMMRLTLNHRSRRRIVLEADTKHNAMAVYDFLKELAPPPYFVTQVRIKVVFEAEPGKRAGSKTFTISHPNSCNLNHEGRDAVIRHMLAASRIEPQAPMDDKNT
ncbi:MAG: hypothetical protein AB8G77_24165 [Rhodothermales bacterium]